MTLRDRVIDHVAAHPGERAVDIASAVTARLADVLHVLRDEDTFSTSLRGLWPSDRARVYRLAAVPQERSGTAGSGTRKRPSQCDLIYSVLRDGLPHTAAEIHQRCGYSRLNSRIAELRSRRGLNIVCEHIPGAGTGPDAYRYTLIGTSEPADATPGPSAGSDAPAPPESEQVTVPLPVPAGASDEQLTLGAAA